MKRNVENYPYSCLNDTRTILNAVGMPKNLTNPRSVMTLAALAKMDDTKKWKAASEDYHNINALIIYINQHFPKKAGLDKTDYQPNTRESFRDETLKPFCDAGIVEFRYGVAKNDRNYAYRFTAQFAALIKTYGSEKWDDALVGYLESHQRYTEYLKKSNKADSGYEVEYNGEKLRLDRSAHNKLQKEILDDFAPRFTNKGELLYIGDASNKELLQKESRLRELGVSVPSESKTYPDIIIYDAVDNRIVFIEAYSSTGEFTLHRVKEISASCNCGNDTEIAFVTAFSNTKKMKTKFESIAWETDIWVAEIPDHLIHKNGNKFMGRSPKDYL